MGARPRPTAKVAIGPLKQTICATINHREDAIDNILVIKDKRGHTRVALQYIQRGAQLRAADGLTANSRA